MPSVSQVSSIVMPSFENGTERWMTVPPPGAPSQRTLVTSTSPAGQPLVGVFRAEIR